MSDTFVPIPESSPPKLQEIDRFFYETLRGDYPLVNTVTSEDYLFVSRFRDNMFKDHKIITVTDFQNTLFASAVPASRTITINGVAQDLSENRSWTIAGGVSSFNARTGAVMPASGDYALADITGLSSALSAKQATLVSGTNIKTINSVSLLGAGDIVINGTAIGGAVTGATAGSILFANPDAVLAQDHQNFHYDTVRKKLSVYGTLGSEMVANGSLTGNATGWTLGAGFVYASNAVSHTSNGTAAFTQNISAQPYREYLLVFTISGLTVGTVTPSIGGVSGDVISANGTYIVHIATGYNANAFLSFTPSNTARFTIDNISTKVLSGGRINTGSLNVDGAWSNVGPGTTNAASFNNLGSNTWMDFRFGGILKSTIGANSSGGFDVYMSGGNYLGLYYASPGLSSGILFCYIYPTALVHYGYGGFHGGVIAGSSATPSSTLQSTGSMAAGGSKHITSNQTLDGTASKWFLDASVASCIGTPSASCGTYTNQTDCEKWDAHGGCSWFAGTSCSAFNYTDEGTCNGNSGCSYETAGCGGIGDEYTCSTTSGCSWSSTDCGSFDEATCTSTSGCYVSTSDCSSFNYNEATCSSTSGCYVYTANSCASQVDEGSCTGAGCYWDSMSGTCSGDNSICSGSYFSGCSGTSYTCSGDYYTGICSGTYGAVCTGTPSCGSIDDATNCGYESGCSWVNAITVNLPSVLSCPGRDYWLCNASSISNDAVVTTFAGDTIDFSSSLTLGTFKQCIHITNHARQVSCDGFSEGACTPSGCSPVYGNCSWDSMDMVCSGHASCTGYTDEFNCVAATYYQQCSGMYYLYKNWWVVGNV